MPIRDAILNSDDLPFETVDVPEWGVKVQVRGFTAAEQVKFLESVTLTQDGDVEIDRDRFQTQLVIASTFDPDTGTSVFQQGDADMLQTKSAAAIGRIVTVASRLSGLGGDDAIEAEVTDLGATPSDGS